MMPFQKMKITPTNMRIVLRWVHLILGLVILCYIYSPLHRYAPFELIVKWIIVPVIVFSGIWLWKFQIFNKLFGMK